MNEPGASLLRSHLSSDVQQWLFSGQLWLGCQEDAQVERQELWLLHEDCLLFLLTHPVFDHCESGALSGVRTTQAYGGGKKTARVGPKCQQTHDGKLRSPWEGKEPHQSSERHSHCEAEQ